MDKKQEWPTRSDGDTVFALGTGKASHALGMMRLSGLWEGFR